MTPAVFVDRIIDDGLNFLWVLNRAIMPTDPVRRFMLCIALQESGPKLEARYQNSPSSTPGPARGFYQFEQGGGCTGVLTHPASKGSAAQVCAALTVVPQAPSVWRALEGNDLLATCFARLLIYTDPAPIPTNENTAWDYYLRVWRPGKPNRDAWAMNWSTASTTMLPPNDDRRST